MSSRPLLLLVALAPLAAAQDPLFGTPLLDGGYLPRYAASGDVNGDGRTDVVLDNGTNLFVLLQDADGRLGAPVQQTGVPFLQTIKLADLDGDGDLDLAGVVNSTNATLEELEVQLGAGDGSFGAATGYATSADPTDVEIGDLNEDGAPDLATVTASNTRVTLFFGFGNGSFGPAVFADAGNVGHGLAIGRVNGDAHLDIVLARVNGTEVTLLGHGDGTFTLAPTLSVGGTVRDVALGDVDGDGDTDAFFTYDLHLARLLIGHGDGTFTLGTPISLQGPSRSGFLVDVNEDGFDDAVFLIGGSVAIPEASGFGVMLSHGDGTLGPLARYGSGYPPEDLVVADLNHDGDLDLLAPFVVSNASLSATLLTGNGDGTFGPVVKTGDAPEEAALGDLDQDGVDDLVVACGSDDSVAVHRGLGHGEFDAVETLKSAGDFPVALAVADVTSDGLPDVVIADRTNPGRITVRIGDGAGGLFGGVFTAPGAVPFGMAAADADLDGQLDVAVTCSDGTVRVLRGVGDGSFVLSDTFAAASVSPDAAAFGDLDDDGLPDLVATTTGAFAVTVALNTGGGVFHTGPLLTAPDTWGVAIADVTGDGVADVVSATLTANFTSAFGTVTTWAGTGGGAFAAPEATFTGPGAHELLVRDLDGDGAPDAVALTNDSDDIWILPNRHGPWHDLGQSLAGAQGLPRQRGYGTLSPGSPFEILLTDARPGGATAHVIGLSAINAPFKGGVMVPSPLLINYPLPVDANGNLSLAGNWPGPAASGLALYFQFWTPDPAGPKGHSASNALRATLP